MKQENEITLKIKGSIEELCEYLENKGFEVVDKYLIDDTYFIPKDLKIEELTTREILTKAILARDIIRENENKRSQRFTFKTKVFDEDGSIVSQEQTNCDVNDIEVAKQFLKVIGYKEIMRIKENDIIYSNSSVEIATKDIENGEKLIEIETTDKLNSIDKLVDKVSELNLPVYTDNYFIKKAEIELNKVLKR